MPVGNTKTWQNVGYSINLGGGWNFNDRFGVLAEYSFNRANIPQNTLTDVGEPNGNVHVWSLTLDPIFYYKTSGRIGGYVTGGGGFYRKLTSFTESVYEGDYCSYFRLLSGLWHRSSQPLFEQPGRSQYRNRGHL